MSDGHDAPIDLIRLTFTVDPIRSDEVESYLADLGLDAHGHADGRFIALWEEPEGDLDAIVEGLWSINGTPFEVTHEEFRRTNLLFFHHPEDEGSTEAGRAVA